LGKFFVKFLAFLSKTRAIKGDILKNFKQGVDFALCRVEFINDYDLLFLQHAKAGLKGAFFIAKGVIRLGDHVFQLGQKLSSIFDHYSVYFRAKDKKLCESPEIRKSERSEVLSPVSALIATLSMSNKKLVVLVGPTAVGKTAVAIELANYFSTEIISADSRQIYRELNIGTAKPLETDLARVRHHFINSHSIHDEYDAAQFGRDALKLIHTLFERYDHLILCGGSGLYIKAVCEGFDDIPEISATIREKLMEEYERHGIIILQEKMKALDPLHFQNIDPQNPHRLIRALEVLEGTGKSIASFQRRNKLEHSFSMIKLGLELPREVLFERIDRRMDVMIADGLFEEAESLYVLRNLNALQTVGYQEIFDFMDEKYDKEEAVRLLKRNSRRYAKRQLTWFKRDHEIHWTTPDKIDEMIDEISKSMN